MQLDQFLATDKSMKTADNFLKKQGLIARERQCVLTLFPMGWQLGSAGYVLRELFFKGLELTGVPGMQRAEVMNLYDKSGVHEARIMAARSINHTFEPLVTGVYPEPKQETTVTTAVNEVGQLYIVSETDTLVSETDANNSVVAIYRTADGKYNVVSNGLLRHPNGSPEDVIRANTPPLHG